jgi:hypothetical protein
VSRRLELALLAAGVLLAATGTAAVALNDNSDEPTTKQASKPASPAAEVQPEVLILRRRGGVPRSWIRRVRRADGVTEVATTSRTQLLLRRSRRAGGETVQKVPSGYAIPIDTLVVQPRMLARVLPEAARELRALDSGGILLSRTSLRLRSARMGDRLILTGGRELRVAGIVEDDVVGMAEAVVTGRNAGNINEATRQLVVTTTRPELIERRFGRSDSVRVRALSAGGRAGPRLVARALEIKARFGEFAVGLPYGTDWIRVEPRWLRRNVVTRPVPILGSVTCNRRVFAPLRRALRNLERRGLGRVVDQADYAGCFAPRRIPGSGSLSLHSWGLAIDINAGANPRLGDSRQDPRLVRAMEGAGFTWGGRWPTVPDPMHFELHP